jgi:hypothetical protein
MKSLIDRAMVYSCEMTGDLALGTAGNIPHIQTCQKARSALSGETD